MIKKLMITPWFGPPPVWMDHYIKNVERNLNPYGYDFLFEYDLKSFQQRVFNTIGVRCSIEEGSGKIHDYRAALAEIFAEEVKGYDFWGHTDFDCVYGRVQEFVPDHALHDLDVYTDHWNYICGPWTLYRNLPFVNSLYRSHPNWKGILENPAVSGWVEKDFTQIIDMRHEHGDLRRLYKFQHVYQDFSQLWFDGDKLMNGNKEVFMAHFRRSASTSGSKQYPAGCL